MRRLGATATAKRQFIQEPPVPKTFKVVKLAMDDLEIGQCGETQGGISAAMSSDWAISSASSSRILTVAESLHCHHLLAAALDICVTEFPDPACGRTSCA
jgi:hypothetical protein